MAIRKITSNTLYLLLVSIVFYLMLLCLLSVFFIIHYLLPFLNRRTPCSGRPIIYVHVVVDVLHGHDCPGGSLKIMYRHGKMFIVHTPWRFLLEVHGSHRLAALSSSFEPKYDGQERKHRITTGLINSKQK